MLLVKLRAVVFVLAIAALVQGCQPSSDTDTSNTPDGRATAEKAKSPASQSPDEEGFIPSGTGVEKEKPAAGTGNVQGKVLYNEKPAVGIEVKLCETFSQYMSGCGGRTYTAKTDEQGEYLIKGVPPGVYEGLIAKVFDTNFYVFATSGYVSSAKYRIEDGETYFAPDSNLFKGDLKVTSPKAGSKSEPTSIEITWEPYADAAYYKLSVHADTASGAATDYDLINKRVDGTSYAVDKPLSPGKYRIAVHAFNTNNVKLAESSGDIEFTVTGAPQK